MPVIKYSPECKANAVIRHLQDAVPISQICQDIGVKPTLYYRWQKDFLSSAVSFFQHGTDKAQRQLKWPPSQGQKFSNYQWTHGLARALRSEAAGQISEGVRQSGSAASQRCMDSSSSPLILQLPSFPSVIPLSPLYNRLIPKPSPSSLLPSDSITIA